MIRWIGAPPVLVPLLFHLSEWNACKLLLGRKKQRQALIHLLYLWTSWSHSLLTIQIAFGIRFQVETFHYWKSCSSLAFFPQHFHFFHKLSEWSYSSYVRQKASSYCGQVSCIIPSNASVHREGNTPLGTLKAQSWILNKIIIIVADVHVCFKYLFNFTNGS